MTLALGPDDKQASASAADYSSLYSHDLQNNTTVIREGADLNATTGTMFGNRGQSRKRVSLEEAEQLCGYPLLSHAGNLTKILQMMRELKKQQRQIDTMQKEVRRSSRPATATVSSKGSPMKRTSSRGAPIETERLLKQKRELQHRYDQKRAKHMKNERQREHFRTFLFSNMRIPSKKSSKIKSSL